MKYFGHGNDASNANSQTGVLLVNLGTPSRPVCPGLRDYLSEFLMDPRVIELSWLGRLLLVKGIIVNFRAHKSARNYRKIWTDDGSPLLVNSQNLTHSVQSILGDQFHVTLGMRYGQPSIESALQKLHCDGIREVIVLPLYPQYSGSTNGSVFDAISKAWQNFRWIPSLSFISSYHDLPAYTEAIGNSIKRHWATHGKAERLIMSFHGVPEKYRDQGDPYSHQCLESANNIATYLQLEESEWQLVFQSRFGAQKWLQPYCDETLMKLPREGVKSVDIICPGFSADCLETLEEINQENRALFEEAGGERFNYIPCLNASEEHADLIADLIRQHSTR